MRRSPEDKSASLEQVADALLTASRALVGVALHSLNQAPVEITLPQHRLLVLLVSHGEQTVGTLADRMGIDQSNISRLCDRLERHGLAGRRRSVRDGRAVEVFATPAGRAVLEIVNERRRERILEILANVPRRDFDAMHRAFTLFGHAAQETAPSDWLIPSP